MACCGPKPEASTEPIFYADFAEQPVLWKYYSRHDNAFIESVPKDRVEHWRQELTKLWNRDPRDKCKVPRFTNQAYGWMSKSAVPHLERCGSIKGNLEIFNHVRNDFLENKRYRMSRWDKCVCAEQCPPTDHWKIV